MKSKNKRQRFQTILPTHARDSTESGKDVTNLLRGLYVVSTPIGCARDITLRAIDVLRSADVLAAEDTRVLRRLMSIHEIPLRGRKPIVYNDHSGDSRRLAILGYLRIGKSVALVSDAGTPLLGDPGYRLVQAAVAESVPVTAVPGPSASLAALVVSGLPTDRVMFFGFLPRRAAERRRQLEVLRSIAATLVFFEAPSRLGASLKSLSESLGGDRQAAICRELTKKFEEVVRGSLKELEFGAGRMEPRGEFTIVVAKGDPVEASADDLERDLLALMKKRSLKDAVSELARTRSTPRKEIYRLALKLQSQSDLAEGSE